MKSIIQKTLYILFFAHFLCHTSSFATENNSLTKKEKSQAKYLLFLGSLISIPILIIIFKKKKDNNLNRSLKNNITFKNKERKLEQISNSNRANTLPSIKTDNMEKIYSENPFSQNPSHQAFSDDNIPSNDANKKSEDDQNESDSNSIKSNISLNSNNTQNEADEQPHISENDDDSNDGHDDNQNQSDDQDSSEPKPSVNSTSSSNNIQNEADEQPDINEKDDDQNENLFISQDHDNQLLLNDSTHSNDANRKIENDQNESDSNSIKSNISLNSNNIQNEADGQPDINEKDDDQNDSPLDRPIFKKHDSHLFLYNNIYSNDANRKIENDQNEVDQHNDNDDSSSSESDDGDGDGDGDGKSHIKKQSSSQSDNHQLFSNSDDDQSDSPLDRPIFQNRDSHLFSYGNNVLNSNNTQQTQFDDQQFFDHNNLNLSDDDDDQNENLFISQDHDNQLFPYGNIYSNDANRKIENDQNESDSNSIKSNISLINNNIQNEADEQPHISENDDDSNDGQDENLFNSPISQNANDQVVSNDNNLLNRSNTQKIQLDYNSSSSLSDDDDSSSSESDDDQNDSPFKSPISQNANDQVLSNNNNVLNSNNTQKESGDQPDNNQLLLNDNIYFNDANRKIENDQNEVDQQPDISKKDDDSNDDPGASHDNVNDLLIKQVSNNDTENVEKLLKDRSADVNYTDPSSGQDPLSIACKKLNSKMVTLLLAYNADVKKRYDKDRTILHKACNTSVTQHTYSNKNDIIEALLEKDKSMLNIQDSEGKTALFFAYDNASYNAVTKLLKWKADLNLKNMQNLTVLQYACNKTLSKNEDEKETQIYIIEELAKRKETIDFRNEQGNSALHFACRNQLLDNIEALIKFDADVTLQNTEGDTPLHCLFQQTTEELKNKKLSPLTCSEFEKVIDLMKKKSKGEIINVKNRKDKTALDLIKDSQKKENDRVYKKILHKLENL